MFSRNFDKRIKLPGKKIARRMKGTQPLFSGK
jgi:hypothetical protein